MIAEWQSRVRAQERAEAGVSSWVRFRVRSSVSSLQTLSQSQHVNIKSSQTKCWVFFSVCQPKQSEFLCQQESLMSLKSLKSASVCLSVSMNEQYLDAMEWMTFVFNSDRKKVTLLKVTCLSVQIPGCILFILPASKFQFLSWVPLVKSV